MKWFFFLSCIFVLSDDLSGQTYSELVEYGDQEIVKKDFYQALLFYEQAYQLDSQSVELNWKMAEANRLYKDYGTALYYYQKVYSREGGRIFPLSSFWMAVMQQQLGDYANSKRSFKSAKKVLKTDREAYHYLKSVQSFRSCIWAENQLLDAQTKVVSIGEPVNSADSELAPFIFDNDLYFTSLKADTVLSSGEVVSQTYRLSIFKATKFKTTYSDVTKIKELGDGAFNYANGTVSADGKRFYFSRCNDNYECKIFVGRLENGKLTDIDSLGEIINDVAATTTMPHIAVVNGEEYLFFVSNRYRTLGGLDIWASKITNGNQYDKPFNLGSKINTIEDDISPFYDPDTKRLYFSSSWHQGFGGHDVFYVQMIDQNWRFNSPVNMGKPINSPQNDTYFLIDTIEGDYYFSSNRASVNHVKAPNCCNDIFLVKNTQKRKKEIDKFPDLEALNDRLPVLYFHNDQPDPKTTDTTTRLNYLETYYDYNRLQNKYKREYSKGLYGDEAEEAIEDIEDFFIEYVQKGISDLETFSTLLYKELKKGQHLVITVKGFASPLAKSDYNVNLTKRRIASFSNYLKAYNNGVILPYIMSGQLTVESIPYGEYSASSFVSDNVNDQKNSVYSRKASLERKIEIQSVNIQSGQFIPLSMSEQIHDFGMISAGDQIKETIFKMTNNSNDTVNIRSLINECDCTTARSMNNTLLPGQTVPITVRYNPADDSGPVVHRVLVVFGNGFTKTLNISAEVRD